MSRAYWKHGGLRFWSEDEIELREAFQARAAGVVSRTLRAANPAWRIMRCETPTLTPPGIVAAEYGDDDLFVTNHKGFCMRPETTPGSYEFARRQVGKLPLCVWQVGKSYRREMNDGASAAKLRFNEFWQQEFQCIYAEGTLADYREHLIGAMLPEIARFTRREVRTVESDRLPAYSESTIDIEALDGQTWREVASCSIRNDFMAGAKVAEIAIGLCRIVDIGIR